jgi:hypothetical protein
VPPVATPASWTRDKYVIIGSRITVDEHPELPAVGLANAW